MERMVCKVFERFERHADADQAVHMKAYMQNQFEFLGLPTPLRRRLSKPFLAATKKLDGIDWAFVNACWDRAEREFQYLAVDYLRLQSSAMTPADLDSLKALAQKKSWWDTIDGLSAVAGAVAERYPEVRTTLLDWSVDGNLWLRRMAIEHQRLRRERTDSALLGQILINNLEHPAFFVAKAIGWSLREYGKTNPAWVRDFLDRHHGRMSALSLREACKRLLDEEAPETAGSPIQDAVHGNAA